MPDDPQETVEEVGEVERVEPGNPLPRAEPARAGPRSRARRNRHEHEEETAGAEPEQTQRAAPAPTVKPGPVAANVRASGGLKRFKIRDDHQAQGTAAEYFLAADEDQARELWVALQGFKDGVLPEDYKLRIWELPD